MTHTLPIGHTALWLGADSVEAFSYGLYDKLTTSAHGFRRRCYHVTEEEHETPSNDKFLIR
jgi:hypothetical protein